MFVMGQLIFHSIGLDSSPSQAPRDALRVYQCALRQQMQGFTMVGLIFQVPSRPRQP